VFPEFGTGDGAVYRIDNVRFRSNLPQATPVITSDAITKIVINNAYNYTLTASDADGDDLTLAAPILPQWLSFNSTTGILSGTPTTANIGVHNVSLSVDDGTEQAIQAFSLMVSLAPNTAPSITSQAKRFVSAGVTYSYRVQVFDAEGDTLTLSLTSAPDWLTLDNASGILSGTPTNANVGGHDVNVMVRDGSNSVTQNFRITVRAIDTNEQTVSSSGGGSLGLWMLLMVMAAGVRKPISRRNCLKR
jgi:hypothetical protein